MIKYIKSILLFTLSFYFNNLTAQVDQDVIKKIRKEFQIINSKLGEKITLNDEEFLKNTTDRGAELSGYYKDGVIIKIVQSIGVSQEIETKEFYFKNEHLIFVYKKVDSFNDVNNPNKSATSFEGRYYFDNNKLIHQIIGGKNQATNKESEKVLLSQADEYLELIKVKEIRSQTQMKEYL